MDALDMDRLWDAHIMVSPGELVHGGTIIAEVPETRAIVHKCMVPPDVEGTVVEVKPDGEYRIHDTLVTVELRDGTRKELSMMQRWADPCGKTYAPEISGQCTADHGAEDPGYHVSYREGRKRRRYREALEPEKR